MYLQWRTFETRNYGDKRKEDIHMNTTNSQNRMFVLIPSIQSFIAIVLIFSLLMSCATDKSAQVGGAVGGAVMGAAVGLLYGAVRGNPEAGLALGVAVGAGQGAYQVWKEEQEDERARMREDREDARTKEIAEAIRESGSSGTNTQPNASATSRAREELTRFIGIWTMEGWMQEPGGQRRNVSANVNGTVEMTYFIELAYIDLKVTGIDAQLWGTSMLGYDEDDGYNISTRMNTLPEPVRTTGGTFDQPSRSFRLKGADYRVVVRFENPDRFTIETFFAAGGQEQQVEFYTFTRS